MTQKRVISVLTALACMLSILCVFGQINRYSGNANKVSALNSLTAEDITSQMTIGWNLGNSLDSTNDSYSVTTAPGKFATSWGNPEPTQKLIETVKNAGFNTIRIPTSWYNHLIYDEATGSYSIEENWLNYVKQVVDWAYDLDMFIILNIHHEKFINVAEFTDETLAEAQTKMTAIWSTLAETFKDYDQHLIFEGMNEPRQTGNANVSEWGNGGEDNGYSWNYVNTLNETFIKTVRGNKSTANQERLLMIPGYVATSDAKALQAITIPDDAGNIAISVHAYSPYFFTMDTSEYANHSFPGASGWGEDYETSLQSLFSSLNSVSESKGLPIIIGEFSASDFENTADRVEWAKCYLSNAKKYNIPCVLWDNNLSADGTGEAHGYIYRLTNTIFPNSADVLKAMMDTVGVTDYVLPEYQEYQPPKFDWSDIPVTEDWKEIYKSESGETLDAWDNIAVSNWKEYLNEDYKLALVYDASTDVELVLQGGWYRIPSSSNTDFIAYFEYEDIIEILNSNEVTLDEMDNLFLSATSGVATMYGLYAIPVNDIEVTTTTTTTTEPTTTTSNIDVTGSLFGDANCDGSIKVNDVQLIRQYLLHLIDIGEDFTEEGFANADVTHDGDVKVNDIQLIRQYILHLVEYSALEQ